MKPHGRALGNAIVDVADLISRLALILRLAQSGSRRRIHAIAGLGEKATEVVAVPVCCPSGYQGPGRSLVDEVAAKTRSVDLGGRDLIRTIRLYCDDKRVHLP